MDKKIIIAIFVFGLVATAPAVNAGFWDWMKGNAGSSDQASLEPAATSDGGSQGGGGGTVPPDIVAIHDLPGNAVISDYLVLKSEDGSYWKVSIDNEGNLNTEKLGI